MRSLLFQAVFILVRVTLISGFLYKFVPNLTISDTNHPSPFWNCAKNKPVQNAAVYMGLDIVDETDFLDDSEIIFGESVQVRPRVSWNEPNRCSKQDLESSVTYSWHDPANWVNIDENGIISNFVHAQMVPGDTDMVVFPNDSSYLVVMNLPIRVGLIQANNFNHSTKSFLQHMRSYEGGLQFRFGPSIMAEYVWSDLNLITDALTITSRGCDDDRGCLNSNVDKKTMSEICSHVSCPKVPACEKPVRPVGHCCDICGFLLNFESNEHFIVEKFSIWTRYLKLTSEKHDIELSVMKIGENLHQVVIIMENSTLSYDYDTLKRFVDLFLLRIQQKGGDGGIVKESIKIVGFSENVKNSAVTIIICVVVILIVGLIIGYWKREQIRNLFVRERVNLTAFWGSDKASEPHRDDRMLLEFSRETGASSSTLSVVSSSDGRSLKAPKLDFAAVPKKFKELFGAKKRSVSSTSGERSLEMRYPNKRLSIADTAREVSSATTFTNPMFDKNYSLEYDE